MKHLMAGNEEQMRMRGGWKGLPLPAAHWAAMTTFSPEAPSSLHPAPLFALVIPSSICVHRPLLFNSRCPHHNRSLSFSVGHLDLEEKRSALLLRLIPFFFFFPSSSLHPTVAFLELFSLFPAALPPSSPPLPSSPLCRPVLLLPPRYLRP